MSKNDGGSAFPVVVPGLVYPDGSSEPPQVETSGLSLRDYFAAKAVQGLCASPDFHSAFYQQNPRQAALFGYAVADEMLEVRKLRTSNVMTAGKSRSQSNGHPLNET